MKQSLRHSAPLLFGMLVAFVSGGGCAGKTGGDRCSTNADCGGELVCLPNMDGSNGGCTPNADQPNICGTPCETDADCADAEFGHKEAPVCLPDCSGAKSCSWDPGF